MDSIKRNRHIILEIFYVALWIALLIPPAFSEDLYLEESIIQVFSGHNGPIYSVSFSPDSKKVLTSSQDTKLKIWDIITGSVLVDLDREYYVLDAVISKEDALGQRLLTGDADGLASFWNAKTGTFIRAFTAHSQRLSTVSYSPNAKWFLTGSYDNTVKVWNADSWNYETVQLKATFAGHTDKVSSAAFSPNSTMVVSGSWDKTAKVWYAQSGALISTFSGHTSSVFSVDFAPDGTHILTGSGEPDNTAGVWIWSGSSGTRIGTCTGHTAAVNSAVYSPDGSQILTGSSDGSVIIWNSSTYQEILSFDDPGNPVHSVAYSSDGNYILAGYEDDTAVLRWLGPSLKVTARDSFNNTVISNATVSVSIGETKLTDTTGLASFRFLPLGDYTVEVSKPGYQSKIVSATINKATTTILVVELPLNEPPNIFTTTLPLAETGIYYETKIEVKGGRHPLKYNLAYGKLPFGTALNPDTGTISGVPTVAAHYLFGVGVTDANDIYTEKEFIIQQVDALSFTSPERLPNGTIGETYSYNLQVYGGVPPYTASVVPSSGALPSGLTMTATGSIIGIPTKEEIATFTAKVTDSRSRTGFKIFYIEIFDKLIVNMPQLKDGVVDKPYDDELKWKGGNYTGPYKWEIHSGNLPTGMSLVQLDSQTWKITGTPKNETFQTIVLAVTDVDGRIAYKSFSFRVVYPMEITRDSLPTGGVGATYSEIIPVRGGIPPYTFSIIGDLPAGLILFNAHDGTISGIPTIVQKNNIDITLTDSSYPVSQLIVKTMDIRITSGLMIRTSRKIQTGIQNVAVPPLVLNAAGGPTPYRWSLAGGFLPPGIKLDSTSGQLTGIPTNIGNYYFTTQVEDAKGITAQKEFVWPVASPLIIQNSTTYQIAKDRDFFVALDAVGGIKPYNWSVSGTLPAGLVFDSSAGTIQGKPTTIGSTVLTITANDSDIPAQNVQKVNKTITFNTVESFFFFTQSVPNGRIGEEYSTSLRAFYGQSPFNWTIESASLPSGLVMKSSSTSVCWIEGVPDKAGTYTFTVAITDTSTPSLKNSRSFTIDVYDQVTLSSTTLRKWISGISYSFTLQATGGKTPYLWDIVWNRLPPGFSLNPNTGEISGIPSTDVGASYDFMVRASDSGVPQRSDTKTYTLELVDDVEIITNPTLPLGTVNQSYTVTIEGLGGLRPYEWIIINQNSLPPGLSINSASGTISGIPSKDGIYSFIVYLFDSSKPSKNDTKSFTIQVLPPPITPTPTPTITPTPVPGATPTLSPTPTPVLPSDRPVIVRTLGNYRSPGEYNVNLQITMNGFVTSLGIQETLPDGWTFVSSSREPIRNSGREIEWKYETGIDEVLSYIALVPSGQTGDKNFTGVFNFSFNGNQTTLQIEGSTVASPIGYHSADYNKDWSISIDEIVYAARLYNVVAYYIGDGDDGYTTTISNRDGYPHSADLNRDWNIILDEIVYAARLYNATSYKIGDGDDGYSAVFSTGKRLIKNSESTNSIQCIRTIKNGSEPGTLSVHLDLKTSGLSSGLGVVETYPDTLFLSTISPEFHQHRDNTIEWFFPVMGNYSIKYTLLTPGNDNNNLLEFSGKFIYTDGDYIVKKDILTSYTGLTSISDWLLY